MALGTESAVLIFKDAKALPPEPKRSAFIQGIARLENALESGRVKQAAVPGAEKLLAAAKKTKLVRKPTASQPALPSPTPERFPTDDLVLPRTFLTDLFVLRRTWTR